MWITLASLAKIGMEPSRRSVKYQFSKLLPSAPLLLSCFLVTKLSLTLPSYMFFYSWVTSFIPIESADYPGHLPSLWACPCLPPCSLPTSSLPLFSSPTIIKSNSFHSHPFKSGSISWTTSIQQALCWAGSLVIGDYTGWIHFGESKSSALRA